MPGGSCLLARPRPGTACAQTEGQRNLNDAFQVAANAGVPKLLDASDVMTLRKADENLLVIYLTFLYQWLHAMDPDSVSTAKKAVAPTPVATRSTPS